MPSDQGSRQLAAAEPSGRLFKATKAFERLGHQLQRVMLSSDVPTDEGRTETTSPSAPTARKKRTKKTPRVKYWTLPTMSSGTFNPRLLTERQQLQYLAQKSIGRETEDSLEMSPLRLDRIKLEEMRSMRLSSELSMVHDKTALPSSPLMGSSSSVTRSTIDIHTRRPARRALKRQLFPDPLDNKYATSVMNPDADASILDGNHALLLKADTIAFSRPPAVALTADTSTAFIAPTASTSPTTPTALTSPTADSSSAHENRFGDSLRQPVKKLLSFVESVRRRHLDSLLASMARRLGVSETAPEMTEKRRKLSKLL